MERDLKIRVFHNARWRFPGYGLNRNEFSPSVFPLMNGEYIEEIDITPFVLSWNCQYQLGNPHGSGTINVVPFKNLMKLNRNDVVVIDQRGTGTKRELIYAGLLDSGHCSRSITKDGIETGLSFATSEIGKYMVRHELFYNQYSTESSDAFMKWQAAGLVLGAKEITREMGTEPGQWQMALEEGFPARIIRKIIETKLMGKGTPFEGGFYVNDGRRLADWLDLSHLWDKLKPDTGNAEIDRLFSSDPVVLAYSVIEGSTLEGSIWNLISQFVGQPLYELFTYTDYDGNQQIKSYIVLRPLPFYDRHYGFDLWDNLPVFEYGIKEVGDNENWGWSDSEDKNLYLFHASQGILGSEDLMAQHLIESQNAGDKLRIPIIMGPHIERYGLLKGLGQINAIPLMNADMKTYAHQALEAATFRFFDHNWLNGYFLNGSLNIELPRRVPKVGYRAMNTDTGMESYVTGITINGGMGQATKLDLQLTRGMHRDVYKHFNSLQDSLLGNWSGENI